jgi:glyoxylase-like metal-dependent hydrolase (beta-lactamase superfamily II)
MRIHALSTGTVRVKDSFLHPRGGIRRQLGLLTPGPFSDPLPIHVWVVEHEGTRILVDAGEISGVNDVPFARFDVDRSEELSGTLASIGLEPSDIDVVVLTHMHGDHIDGAVHLNGAPVLVNAVELAHSRTARARFFQRVLRQPVPAGVMFEPIDLAGGPFGAFEASLPLTPDRRIVAVATPGHTPGHTSVVCIDDDGRHAFLAGDATDSLEQLQARRPDPIGPKPAVTVATIDRILAHAARHPVVYLPSHDPESMTRLAEGAIL